MIHSRNLAAGLCFGAALTSACAAQAASLNVKPGLWEMTMTGQASGAPPVPPELLAKMPPDRRAKYEAAVAGSMGRMNQPHVRRHCVTLDQLQRGFDIEDKTQRSSCRKTVTANNGAVMDWSESCTGQRTMNAQIRLQAVNPETVAGQINMSIGDANNTMTIKQTINGRWLGADCGGVKD
jgi:hypothetical protein